MEGKSINNYVEKITFHILSIFNKNTHGNKLEYVNWEMSLYILIRLTSSLKHRRSVMTVKMYSVITLCILNTFFHVRDLANQSRYACRKYTKLVIPYYCVKHIYFLW